MISSRQSVLFTFDEGLSCLPLNYLHQLFSKCKFFAPFKQLFTQLFHTYCYLCFCFVLKGYSATYKIHPSALAILKESKYCFKHKNWNWGILAGLQLDLSEQMSKEGNCSPLKYCWVHNFQDWINDSDLLVCSNPIYKILYNPKSPDNLLFMPGLHNLLYFKILIIFSFISHAFMDNIEVAKTWLMFVVGDKWTGFFSKVLSTTYFIVFSVLLSLCRPEIGRF